MKIRILTTCAALWLTLGAHALAEGYLFKGESGYANEFSLIGGTYKFYVDAHWNPASEWTPTRQECLFSGAFERFSPNPSSQRIGTTVRISLVPYKVDTTITLPRGLYRLFVAPLSDCKWAFALTATAQNDPGLSALSMLRGGSDLATARDQTTASFGQTVQFYAQYRAAADSGAPSGKLELLHGGSVVKTLPLLFGHDNDSGEPAAYVNVRWSSDDKALLGESIARFTLHTGSKTFVSTKAFTLTDSA